MEKIILKKKLLSKQFIALFILFFSIQLFANNFVKSEIKQGELRLFFASDIKKVTYFKLPQKDGVTKYVYDIHGGVLPEGRGVSHHTFRTIKSFRLGQNSYTVLRLVIQSKEKDLNRHQFQGNVLAIPLIAGKKSSFKGSVIEDAEQKHLTLSQEPSDTEKKIVLKKVEKKEEAPNVTIQRRDTILEDRRAIHIPRDSRYIIVIDAGHGGKDNGASCCGNKKEKQVTLSVAVKLKNRLEKKGYKVYMTRSDDRFVKLPKRTEFANQKKADIFVSIHANAAPSKDVQNIFKGIEVYYLSPAKTERAKKAAKKENAVMFEGKDFYTKNAYVSLISREKIVESHKLGLDVSYKMLSNINTSYGAVEDGGVKPANFWVLVGAQMPAILVETGYITHPTEGESLMNDFYKDLLAKGISEGISRYLKNIGR